MDKALKQRLVGASVLIILAVIVLPMLLSGQPEWQQDTRNIEVPPKPSELSFETRRFPIGEQPDGQPSVVQADPPVSAPAQQAEAANGQAAGTAAPNSPRPNEAQGVASPGGGDQEATAPGRYLVQVASFSTTSNANRLASRLEEDGLPVLMDTIVTNAGQLNRVRVGPFDLETKANEVVAELRVRLPDLRPRVLDLRPDENAPVTDPSDPLVRWVVQAGSFSDEANALSLQAQLRAEGFTAYTDILVDGSGTVFKVRVGPVIERASAVRLASEIERKMAIESMVMSVD